MEKDMNKLDTLLEGISMEDKRNYFVAVEKLDHVEDCVYVMGSVDKSGYGDGSFIGRIYDFCKGKKVCIDTVRKRFGRVSGFEILPLEEGLRLLYEHKKDTLTSLMIGQGTHDSVYWNSPKWEANFNELVKAEKA